MAIACFGLLISSSASASPPAAVANKLGSRIQAKPETHPHTGVQWGHATAVVDAPFDHVMRIVQDYDRYHEFLPHFRASKVLSRRGTNALMYMEAGIIHDTTTLWAQTRIYMRPTDNATKVIESRMVRGNMDRFVARWEATPLDGGEKTLLEFRLLVEPRLPLPASVFSRENVRSARRAVRALRHRAENPRLARRR